MGQPNIMKLEKTHINPNDCNFLDLTIHIHNGEIFTK